MIGLEISAALKNIVALAAGICDGLGYGLNTRAALITRGLAEITRLGVYLGRRAEHVFRIERSGGSGSDLYWRSQPEQECRHPTRKREEAVSKYLQKWRWWLKG